MKFPKLFENQPSLEAEDLEKLTKKGFLVPDKITRTRAGVCDEVAQQAAGEVVCYPHLANALKDGKVTQDDARRLLAIEAVRGNGRPRNSHISRLMVVAFSHDKMRAMDKINQTAKKLWAKKV